MTRNPFPALVAAALVVAALGTAVSRVGWLLWIPTALAIAVVAALAARGSQ